MPKNYTKEAKKTIEEAKSVFLVNNSGQVLGDYAVEGFEVNLVSPFLSAVGIFAKELGHELKAIRVGDKIISVSKAVGGVRAFVVDTRYNEINQKQLEDVLGKYSKKLDKWAGVLNEPWMESLVKDVNKIKKGIATYPQKEVSVDDVPKTLEESIYAAAKQIYGEGSGATRGLKPEIFLKEKGKDEIYRIAVPEKPDTTKKKIEKEIKKGYEKVKV